MIKSIIFNDKEILSRRSDKVTESVNAVRIAQDLFDTALAPRDDGKLACGLSAVQIGEHYRIAIINTNRVGYAPFVICNPVIIARKGKLYEEMEGCMSFDGERLAKRYTQITLFYSLPSRPSKVIKQDFKGKTAQIIQHEIDHMNGILI